MMHELKSWPEFFAAALSGEKTFELRNNDRAFEVGDTLRLREYNPVDMKYSGREIERKVSYLLGHRPGAGCAADFGLSNGYVILGLAA